MPVYTRHRLSANHVDVAPLEAFPSIERAGRALQLRADRQKSATYFHADAPPDSPGIRPEQEFPLADRTGFMAVWLRRPSDGPPPHDAQPDELWYLARTGGLRREAWGNIARLEVVSPLEASHPEGLLHAAMTPAQRRTKALAYGQQMPPVTAEFNAGFGGIPRRVLEALVPDKEALDVVLRMLQEAQK